MKGTAVETLLSARRYSFAPGDRSWASGNIVGPHELGSWRSAAPSTPKTATWGDPATSVIEVMDSNHRAALRMTRTLVPPRRVARSLERIPWMARVACRLLSVEHGFTVTDFRDVPLAIVRPSFGMARWTLNVGPSDGRQPFRLRQGQATSDFGGARRALAFDLLVDDRHLGVVTMVWDNRPDTPEPGLGIYAGLAEILLPDDVVQVMHVAPLALAFLGINEPSDMISPGVMPQV